MEMVLSIGLVVASAFGSEWLVDGWLGEGRRYWVGLFGFALLLLSGALVKASGINALASLLRRVVIGAGIGAALDRAGVRAPWLRSGLRWVGIETEPQAQDGLRGVRVGTRMLWAGSIGTLVGIGLVWTGVFGG